MSELSPAVRRPTVRAAILGYAGIAYASFLLASAWAVLFLADVGVPLTVDRPARRATLVALLVDAALLMVFAIQHTVMARARFKQWLAALLPPAAERSTYVLASSLALMLLFWQWQSVPAHVWWVTEQPWTGLVWVLYAIGWVVAVSSTFMIDHWDFLGLRQAYALGDDGHAYKPPGFSEKWLYAWVRHPMMLGLVIAFWATPRMSVGHLFFALGGTAYILVGIRFEERKLIRELGGAYGDYAQRVPALVPVRGRSPMAPAR
ncbi:MAG TPA: NnrU family protein [Micromonosporaceae bacterium]|nr:NnrU family protein [Micromonosporaceae bacterium]